MSRKPMTPDEFRQIMNRHCEDEGDYDSITFDLYNTYCTLYTQHQAVVDAFRKYSAHSDDCYFTQKCTCGLDKLRTALAQEGGE